MVAIGAAIFGAVLTRELDWLIESFEYDADQELYQKYVAESIFETINQEVTSRQDPATKVADLEKPIVGLEKPSAGDRTMELAEAKKKLAEAEKQLGTSAELRALVPKLVIHAGDAIDSGTTSELRQVHRLVDRLQIPFFNLLGNHDILTFGNLVPTPKPKNPKTDDDDSCATVHSLAKSRLNLGAWWAVAFINWNISNKLCVDPDVLCPNCFQNEVELVADSDRTKSREKFMDGFRHEQFAILPQLRHADDDWHCFEYPRSRRPAPCRVFLGSGRSSKPPKSISIARRFDNDPIHDARWPVQSCSLRDRDSLGTGDAGRSRLAGRSGCVGCFRCADCFRSCCFRSPCSRSCCSRSRCCLRRGSCC